MSFYWPLSGLLLCLLWSSQLYHIHWSNMITKGSYALQISCLTFPADSESRHHVRDVSRVRPYPRLVLLDSSYRPTILALFLLAAVLGVFLTAVVCMAPSPSFDHLCFSASVGRGDNQTLTWIAKILSCFPCQMAASFSWCFENLTNLRLILAKKGISHSPDVMLFMLSISNPTSLQRLPSNSVFRLRNIASLGA